MRLVPVLAGLLWGVPVAAQTPTSTPAPAAAQSPGPLTYRGFVLAAPYRAFTEHARVLEASDSARLLCNTSRRTAQLMECGVQTLDPTDSAHFYVAAYVLEGKVAFLSFGDSGTSALVGRAQRDMEAHFGRPRASRAGMWEWRSGRQVARLTWRGRGSARWIYIALWDEPLMDRIQRYVPRRTH
jgi:hypothetical protein